MVEIMNMNHYFKKIKIKQNIILGIGLIIVFILLLVTISTYQKASMDLKREIFAKYKKTHFPDSEIFICEKGTPIEECSKINDKNISEYVNENTKDLKKPFNPKYQIYFLPFIGLIGIIVGIAVYYIMSDKIQEKNKTLYKNTDIILKLLSKAQRKIISKLLDNNGKIRQYELVNLSEFNKVKIHRILRQLEDENIIKKEKIGKVNNIILDKEIYNILKK
jgi:uncharacterized membrane protein